MVLVCSKCGSKDVDATVVAIGYQQCNACGHPEAKVAVSQKGNPDLIGSIMAIGAIALGAVVVGALVDSLLSGSERSASRSIDETRRFKSLR